MTRERAEVWWYFVALKLSSSAEYREHVQTLFSCLALEGSHAVVLYVRVACSECYPYLVNGLEIADPPPGSEHGREPTHRVHNMMRRDFRREPTPQGS